MPRIEDGTFGQGISINDIFNIFFVESYKSERIIRQSFGRGMRLCLGKDEVNVIDFVDDFSILKSQPNHLLKHGRAREVIYTEQGVPYKKFNVKL